MLHRVGFPPAGRLVHHLSTGFPLAGEFPLTGVFPPAVREATFEVQDLWRDAAEIRDGVLGSIRGSGDAEMGAKLHELTMDEQLCRASVHAQTCIADALLPE